MKFPTGKECKKTNCVRYENYIKWDCGDRNLDTCIKCKWAFPSQFARKRKP
jgi:hypothetical protein